MKKASLLATLVVAGSIFGSLAAHAATYSVSAEGDSIAGPLDTLTTLAPATTYDFVVQNAATTIWSAGNNDPYSRDSTAAGIDPVASGYGQWTENGFTANYGALVGDSGGTYFLIGQGTSMAGLGGDLQLMYWDGTGEYGDNSGTQTVSVSAVPLPPALPLFAAAFMGLVGFGIRKSRQA